MIKEQGEKGKKGYSAKTSHFLNDHEAIKDIVKFSQIKEKKFNKSEKTNFVTEKRD